jgi:hypothetical protein
LKVSGSVEDSGREILNFDLEDGAEAIQKTVYASRSSKWQICLFLGADCGMENMSTIR